MMNAKLNEQRAEMYDLMTGRLHGTEITEEERRTLLWVAGMERSSARNIAAIFDKVYGEGYFDGVKAVADAVNTGSKYVAAPVMAADGTQDADVPTAATTVYAERREGCCNG